jgi:C1A family cysteine protease
VYAAGSYYFHISNDKPYADSTLLSPKYTYNQITKGTCNCTSITDHLYLLQTQGACSLKDMPYDANECAKQPDSAQRSKAAQFKIKNWNTVDMSNITLVKQQLLHKMSVIFSTWPDNAFFRPVPPYLLTKRTGDSKEGHALVVCGYNDAKKAFRVMNSWSDHWADKGFVWIDYTFFVKNLKDPLGYVIVY